MYRSRILSALGQSKRCQNVKILRQKQLGSFTYNDDGELVAGDPLILLCTYSAVQGGYSPDLYVKKLFASLTALVDEEGNDISKDDFVQLTANSTVKDVMGKICVVIRPGDDERWAQKEDNDISGTPKTTDYSPYGYTYSLKNLQDLAGSEWWDKVLLISDWGMDSWDSWHRRFGKDNLIRDLSRLPEEIRLAAVQRDPSRLNRYATQVATAFHQFYTECRIKDAAPALREARILLSCCTASVIKNALSCFGVSAPDHM